MKFRLSILIILSLLFISCRGSVSQDDTGSVTIDAGKLAKYLSSNTSKNSRTAYSVYADDIPEGGYEYPPVNYVLTVKIATEGDYTDSAEKSYSRNVGDFDSDSKNPFTMEDFYKEAIGTPLTISSIPVGSSIKVRATLTFSQEIDWDKYAEWYKKINPGITDEEIKQMLEHMKKEESSSFVEGEGVSDSFVVKSGVNNITIRLLGEGKKDHHGEGGDDDFIPVVLWNNRTTEYILKYAENAGDTNVDATETGITYTLGTQVLPGVYSNMQITSPNLPSNVYCFGDDCIYAVRTEGDFNGLTTASIEKYSINSYGCVKDTTFTPIDLLELFPQSGYGSGGELTDIQALAYAEFDNQGYLFVGFNQYDNKSFQSLSSCGAISIDNPDKIYTINISQQQGNMIAIAAKSKDSILYIYYLQGMNLRYLKVDAIGSDSYPDWLCYGNVGNRAVYSTINLSSQLEDTLEISSTARPSDLQIIGDYLYILFYDYSTDRSNDPVMIYNSSNTETEPDALPLHISNGGIAKIKITESMPSFENWVNHNDIKVLGWYKQDYYDEDRTKVENATIQPPLNKSAMYFYGAKKFVARKPDELIIADDGVYIEARSHNGNSCRMAEGSVSSVNMNRIVTVNLLDESISAVNVNVAFDVSVGAVTSFGIVEE